MHIRTPRRFISMLAVVGLVLVTGVPVIAQDESPAVDVEVTIGSGDLASQLPAEVIGLPLEVSTFPGETLIEGVDSDDPDVAQDVADLQAMLDTLGARIDQVAFASATAFDDEGGVIAFGLQIMGVDASSFGDPWITLYTRGEYEEPELADDHLGGKDVLSITDAGSLAGQPSYAYASGDVVWILIGDEEHVGALLEALP